MATSLLPLADLTLAIFAIVVAAFYLPALGWATFTLDVAGLPLAWALVAGIIGAGAVLFRGPTATATASLGAPVVGGLGVGCVYQKWFQYETLPLIYAVSSAIALATLFIVYSENAREWMKYRTSVAILSSVQWILASSTFAGSRGFLFGLPSSELFATASVWMLSSSVLSILLFEYGAAWLHTEASRRWGVVLRAFAMLFFVVCLATDGFDLVQRMAVVISLIVAAMHECHVAVRRQDQRHVAGVFVIVGLIIGWFHWQHQISVPHVILPSLAVAAAGICLILARRLTDHPRLGVLVRGRMIAALALPPAVAVWSLFDSGHGPSVLVILIAIGLRLRALIHVGSAFLFVDLVAMVI